MKPEPELVEATAALGDKIAARHPSAIDAKAAERILLTDPRKEVRHIAWTVLQQHEKAAA